MKKSWRKKQGQKSGGSTVPESLFRLNNNLVSDLKINDAGKLVVTKGGADTVLNFSGAGLKLLHIRHVVGASGMSPYGSINVQFKNESAKYL